MLALGVGLLISLLFYLSILSFDHLSLTSWGDINSFSDLLRHILRYDYGTFNLISSVKNRGWFDVFLQNITSYFNKSSLNLFPVFCIFLLSICFGFKEILGDQKIQALLLTYFLYLTIFFSLSEISIKGAGEEVFSRFLPCQT